MPTKTHTTLISTLTGLAMGLQMLVAAPSAIAEDQPTFEMTPHCNVTESENVFGGPMPDIDLLLALKDGTCQHFLTKDPQTRETSLVKAGDTIDIDLIAHNPQKQPISRVRAWIFFDPTVLDGVEVTLNKNFTAPTPGEMDILSDEGYIKIGATAATALTSDIIPVARIKLKVKDGMTKNTVLSFYDVSTATDGKTVIATGTSPNENMLSLATPSSLLIRLEQLGAGATSSSPGLSRSVSSSTRSIAEVGNAPGNGSAASVIPPPTPVTIGGNGGSTFGSLQVQGLRATTDGTTVYLAWDALQSSELVGYNVYYGTVSGKYLQRRSVDKNSNTLTLRGLPLGTTYFFAVRGVNASTTETEFSQEASVAIGNPGTSTNPLTGNVNGGIKNNGTISGNSGPTSIVLVLVLLAGVIGTGFAVRRQMIAASLQQ